MQAERIGVGGSCATGKPRPTTVRCGLTYDEGWSGARADPSSAHGPNDPEIRPSRQDLRHLRAAVRVAEEMGQGLGRGALLFGALPAGADGLIRTGETAKIGQIFRPRLLPIGNLRSR